MTRDDIPGARADADLLTLAVRDDGRRAAAAPEVHELDAARLAARLVALDHAGPDASRHMAARAVGPAAVAAVTGRVPRALDEAGWRAIDRAFVDAAARLRAAGVARALVRADEDGLLAAALSPLKNPDASEDARCALVARVVHAVRSQGLEVGVTLTVEEGAPGGLDPAGGVRAARAVVDAGASLLVASGGSARFPPLHRRARASGDDDAWLAPGLWLRGRVPVPVLARGPARDPARALERALGLGLAGVVAVQVAA